LKILLCNKGVIIMFKLKIQLGFILSAVLIVFNAQANFAITEAYEVGGDNAPNSELVDDINGDGFDDIITSVDMKLMILFGSETGTIKNKYTLRQYYPIKSMVTGDFNGNGDVDLAVHIESYYYSKVFIYFQA